MESRGSAALCKAQALKCHTCNLADSNSKCMTETTCPSADTHCLTAVGTASVGSITATVITKECAAACTAGAHTYGGITGTVSCCESDLCNVSGATGVKLSSLALLVPAGFVLSLLRAAL
ncbi:lymphocyte antigen 6E-like isoform X2 [Rhinatrema bivittatum]|uniref:lymphocyte antigen 6E-like isoform X2 n=1 Tax=Rhinatrema bivittatum TaxID=194408 RepID=UPI00112CA7C0|nr:lymphocyte antigen 6E-like isoform X2 [Rhinatrema bivittatum]